MNDQDMRVVKTRESIDNALFQLLQKKPLGKITVAELARTARINKSTFYLHYLDISDLYSKTVRKNLIAPLEEAAIYNDFFDAPERFAQALERLFARNIPKLEILLQGQHKSIIFDEVVECLIRRVFDTGRLQTTPANARRLNAIFGAVLCYSPKYFDTPDADAAITAALIRFFFPKETTP